MSVTDKHKINIVFLIDELPGPHGGTEGQLLMLLKNINKEIFNPYLIILRRSEWVEKSGSEFNAKMLNVKSLMSLGTLRQCLEFRKYCQLNKIEIIQTYFNDSYIFGALAGKLSGVKIILSCRRNLGPGFWGKRSLLFVFRILKHITSRFIANSMATKESIVRFEGIKQERVDVIYNGLDLQKYELITEDYKNECRKNIGYEPMHNVIGMVSHFRPEKNILLFINAAAIILDKYPTARFILVGTGPMEADIKKSIERLHLEKYFYLPGPVMNIVPYLAAMNIACLTSDGESYSNAIIEYMAAGLPVVATAVGGNVEAIKNIGILIPPRDETALVSSILELLKNPTYQNELSIKGKKEAFEKYSIKKMVTEYENLYKDCI